MTLVIGLLSVCVYQLVSFNVYHNSESEFSWNKKADFILNPFQAPSLTSSRSPCPMLNTLANHGYLNREGRFITRESLKKALNTVGLDDEVAATLLEKADQFALDPDTKTFSLDLVDLSKHGILEHDISLTRNDFHLGDNLSRNETLIDNLLKFANEDGTLDTHSIAKARNARLRDSKLNNPSYSYGFREQFVADSECAVFLQIVGRSGMVSRATAESVLKHERFPDDWAPPRKDVELGHLLLGTFRCALYRWLPNNWA